MGAKFAFVAELLTVIYALENAQRFAWDHFLLESDSSFVVNMLVSGSFEVF